MRRAHRRVGGFRSRAFSDAEVVQSMRMLWPHEMLSAERLRHLGRVLSPVLWALIRLEGTWLAQVREDVRWAAAIQPFRRLKEHLGQSDFAKIDADVKSSPSEWKQYLTELVHKLRRCRARQQQASEWEGACHSQSRTSHCACG